MCAIIGYTGFKPASPILLDGLRTVEYRGYDSVGMYLPKTGAHKVVGDVDTLADTLPEKLESLSGIAHTRWATHGEPKQRNAHPHSDKHGRVWLVHNGMIENYNELKDELIKQGHAFRSETDSEVLAHLIGIEYDKTKNPRDAVANALSKITGTFAVAVMFSDDPECIVIASMGNKMSIGVNDGEFIIASDTAPLIKHTDHVVHLKDGEYAVVTPKKYSVYSFDHELLKRNPRKINIAKETAKRADKPHHMLKDILELPNVLEDSIRGRILMEKGDAKLAGLEDFSTELEDIRRIVIVASGSSYFAGMVGKLLIEDFAGMPVHIEHGSEFPYSKITYSKKESLILAITQTGETPDIIESVKVARAAGFKTFGLVNVVGSTVSKLTDSGVYNHAGPEVGVRAGKSYMSQIVVLALIALYLGRRRGLTTVRGAEIAAEIKCLPDKLRSILKKRTKIKHIAEEYLGYDDFLFIGRGYNVASGYEGSLKLKKTAYLHAEGYPAGEVQHGPISMLNEIFPTVAIIPSDSVYHILKNDLTHIRKRKGPILAIATEGNTEIKKIADDVMYIPDTKECLTPILVNVPLQLFAYYTGALRGFNKEPPLRPSSVTFRGSDHY